MLSLQLQMNIHVSSEDLHSTYNFTVFQLFANIP